MAKKKKDKRTNNDLQNITEKTKDRTLLQTWCELMLYCIMKTPAKQIHFFYSI